MQLDSASACTELTFGESSRLVSTRSRTTDSFRTDHARQSFDQRPRRRRTLAPSAAARQARTRGRRPARTDRDPVPAADRRRRRLPRETRRRGPGRCLGRCLQGRTRPAATVVKYRPPGSRRWRETDLHMIDEHLGGVRWAGSFDVDRTGSWSFTFEAWTDRFGTWRDELARKVAAGQHDLVGELWRASRCCTAADRARRTKRDMDLLERTLATVEDRAGQRVDQAPGAPVRGRAHRDRTRAGARGRGGARAAAARGRSPAGPVLDLVRAVPAFLGRAEGRRGPTPSTCRARL